MRSKARPSKEEGSEDLGLTVGGRRRRRPRRGRQRKKAARFKAGPLEEEGREDLGAAVGGEGGEVLGGVVLGGGVRRREERYGGEGMREIGMRDTSGGEEKIRAAWSCAAVAFFPFFPCHVIDPWTNTANQSEFT
jgi:hypothetical protein